MSKINKFKQKATDYLFDHYKSKAVLEYTGLFIATTVSALIYSLGFSTFITPVDGHFTIVTGGLSGISQNVVLILKLCGVEAPPNVFQSILYFILNVPLLIFAFIFIGKRFSIFSLINVGLSSLFIALFSNQFSSFTNALASQAQVNDLSRVFFAGVCTGISSGIVYKVNTSAGGMDILSYYFATKKSNNVGRYSVLLNIGTVGLYTILLCAADSKNWASHLVALLYSILYLFTVAIIIDLINIRNKKVQIQIITENKLMTDVLITHFAHGATITHGEGAYTHKEKDIINMIVSSSEANEVVSIVKKLDNHAFVSVTQLVRVSGNFFINPVK